MYTTGSINANKRVNDMTVVGSSIDWSFWYQYRDHYLDLWMSNLVLHAMPNFQLRGLILTYHVIDYEDLFVMPQSKKKSITLTCLLDD